MRDLKGLGRGCFEQLGLPTVPYEAKFRVQKEGVAAENISQASFVYFRCFSFFPRLKKRGSSVSALLDDSPSKFINLFTFWTLLSSFALLYRVKEEKVRGW